MSDRPNVTVTDDPGKHRYVAAVDGRDAGYAVYYLAQGRHLFVHTEVGDAFEGQGVASELVRGALDDVRDKGGSIVALCPYIQRWIGKHDEYSSLIDEELTESLRP